MRLVQFRETANATAVAVVDGTLLRPLEGVASVYALGRAALAERTGIFAAAQKRLSGQAIDYAAIEREGRLLPPITHPDPSRLLVTGTGLTHIGSAQARDQMHQEPAKDNAPESDSMKMFRLGLAAGKPPQGQIGAQPEWFYKGDGDILLATDTPVTMPSFALGAGEEPEIAGVYIIDDAGAPWRIGYSLANDFSDHITERKNYMYIAHSKLRQCPIGPEILLGELPPDVRGESRVLRAGNAIWRGAFASGEVNMSYSIANLEHHHFKYDGVPPARRPARASVWLSRAELR